jgi:hypothetical protein
VIIHCEAAMNNDERDAAGNGDLNRDPHGNPGVNPMRDPNRTMSEPDIERARGAAAAGDETVERERPIRTEHRDHEESENERAADNAEVSDSEPPRTTKGWFTAPKFGSAGSGGAEFEPPTKKP